MTDTCADFLLERLRDWGIERIYGYPGDGINGIMGALNRAGNRPEFIQARHEEMAAFMACGHAKFSGEIGMCLATSGPGAIQLLNGLYDAKLDHQPVLAIVGQQARRALGGSYQQEVDLASLFDDIGAIGVIAIGYTESLDLVALGVGELGVAAVHALVRLGVRRLSVYMLAGTLFSWIAIRLEIGRMPEGVSWRQVVGGGVLAGIGFTMALFIAGLALQDELVAAAKVGVLMASVVSAVVGLSLLATGRSTTPADTYVP